MNDLEMIILEYVFKFTIGCLAGWFIGWFISEIKRK